MPSYFLPLSLYSNHIQHVGVLCKGYANRTCNLVFHLSLHMWVHLRDQILANYVRFFAVLEIFSFSFEDKMS